MYQTNNKPNQKAPLPPTSTPTNIKENNHQTQPYCIPSPYYTLSNQNAITKQSLMQNLGNQKKKLDPRSLKAQYTQKQAPTPQIFQSLKLFDQAHVKNVPTFFHKNKLYLIGEINPSMYKYEKLQIKITDPFTLQVISKFKTTDEQPDRINNMMQVPVYLFEQKAWTVQKLRIRYLTSLATSYTFLHQSRTQNSKLKEKAKQGQMSGGNMPYKKASQREKPILYFPNQLVNMAYCRDTQMPQVMYLFGGLYQQKMIYSNKTWRIDFDSMSLELYEHKGDVPEPRQGAALISYTPLWVILHGGYNLMNCQVFNDFYVFQIQSRSWTPIETDFESYFTPRINFSLSYNPGTKSCYVFGGMIFDHKNKECLLDDLYEFKIIEEESTERRYNFMRRFKGSIETRTLLAKQGGKWPQKSQGHRTFWIDKNLMVLIGGEMSKQQIDLQTTLQSSIDLQESYKDSNIYQRFNDKIWIFDRRTQDWINVLSSQGENERQGQLGTCMDFRIKLAGNDGQADLIIFGGLSDTNIKEINKLTFFTKDYNQTIKKHYEDKPSIKDCQFCMENEFTSQQKIENQLFAPIFPVDMIDGFIFNSMPFVFSAFGQLASLAVQKDSSKIMLSHLAFPHRGETNLLIEEDGYLPYTADEIAQKINQFSIHDSMEIHGVSEKKYKTYQSKLNNISNFCNRLKMAALRLGEELFWMAANAYNQILIYWMRAQTYKNGIGQNETKVYKSYFYAVDETTFEILPQFSRQVKKAVQLDHEQLIKGFYKQKKNLRSSINISGLRKVKQSQLSNELTYEITPDFKRNNVLVNYESLINRNSIFPKSLVLQESIDVNLKAYLSMYFLSRQIKIFVRVNTTGTNNSPSVIKLKPAQMQSGQNTTANNGEGQKQRSNFMIKVQEFISAEVSKGKEVLPLPEPSSVHTHNRSEEVNFQFMLPKIDDKLQKGELIEVELDAFGQFDCKIIEVYYWKGKRNEASNTNKQTLQNHKSQAQKVDLLHSNGLLIYHKGHLVKRYKYNLGMLLLNQAPQSSNRNPNTKQTQNLDQYYRSLNQFNTRLFGLIQVNDKYVTNVFGTEFLNEEFLEKLYERIEHVSMLYEKMYGNWNGIDVGKRPFDAQTQQGRNLSKPETGKSGRKKAKLNENNQLNKQGP